MWRTIPNFFSNPCMKFNKSQFLVFYVCYKLVMMFKWNKLNFDISLTKFNLNTFIVNLTKRTYFNSSECEMLRVWSLVVSFHLIKVTKSPAVISFMAIPHFLIFFYILQLFCNLKLPATLIDTSCLIVRQPMRIQEQILNWI